jgi:hypothetical protein
MNSKGVELFCEACQVRYTLLPNGELQAQNQKTIFSHIPTWFEWQRANVRQQILDKTYRIEDEVRIFSLPNSKGFIPLGKGKLIHDEQGFHLTWKQNNEQKELHNPVSSMYSVHIEFDYNGQGDGIDITTLTDNYYCYFENHKNIVTKIHFATEELFRLGGYKS